MRSPKPKSSGGLTRRQLIGGTFAGAVVTALPLRWARASRPHELAAATPHELLTAAELELVEALTARIVPSDSVPGAREAGVAHYIQGMLSALPGGDANCDRRGGAADIIALVSANGAPTDPGCSGDLDGDGQLTDADLAAAPAVHFNARPIFAGGPYSGRQPFGDFATGKPAGTRPGNSFLNEIPLNRVQRLAWQVRLDGADGVAEVAANPLARELPDVDLRRRYREGLAAIEADSQRRFGTSFVGLTAAQQSQVISAADPTFVNLLTQHTVEGLFCPPEYGGNRELVGWELAGFDGDSQPLGYTLGFDEELQQYIERSDKPNSRPDPGDPCSGFSPGVTRFLSLVIAADETKPSMRFRNPYCFDIDG